MYSGNLFNLVFPLIFQESTPKYVYCNRYERHHDILAAALCRVDTPNTISVPLRPVKKAAVQSRRSLRLKVALAGEKKYQAFLLGYCCYCSCRVYAAGKETTLSFCS